MLKAEDQSVQAHITQEIPGFTERVNVAIEALKGKTRRELDPKRERALIYRAVTLVEAGENPVGFKAQQDERVRREEIGESTARRWKRDVDFVGRVFQEQFGGSGLAFSGGVLPSEGLAGSPFDELTARFFEEDWQDREHQRETGREREGSRRQACLEEIHTQGGSSAYNILERLASHDHRFQTRYQEPDLAIDKKRAIIANWLSELAWLESLLPEVEQPEIADLLRRLTDEKRLEFRRIYIRDLSARSLILEYFDENMRHRRLETDPSVDAEAKRTWYKTYIQPLVKEIEERGGSNAMFVAILLAGHSYLFSDVFPQRDQTDRYSSITNWQEARAQIRERVKLVNRDTQEGQELAEELKQLTEEKNREFEAIYQPEIYQPETRVIRQSELGWTEPEPLTWGEKTAAAKQSLLRFFQSQLARLTARRAKEILKTQPDADLSELPPEKRSRIKRFIIFTGSPTLARLAGRVGISLTRGEAEALQAQQKVRDRKVRKAVGAITDLVETEGFADFKRKHLGRKEPVFSRGETDAQIDFIDINVLKAVKEYSGRQGFDFSRISPGKRWHEMTPRQQRKVRLLAISCGLIALGVVINMTYGPEIRTGLSQAAEELLRRLPAERPQISFRLPPISEWAPDWAVDLARRAGLVSPASEPTREIEAIVEKITTIPGRSTSVQADLCAKRIKEALEAARQATEIVKPEVVEKAAEAGWYPDYLERFTFLTRSQEAKTIAEAVVEKLPTTERIAEAAETVVKTVEMVAEKGDSLWGLTKRLIQEQRLVTPKIVDQYGNQILNAASRLEVAIRGTDKIVIGENIQLSSEMIKQVGQWIVDANKAIKAVAPDINISQGGYGVAKELFKAGKITQAQFEAFKLANGIDQAAALKYLMGL